MKDEYVIINVTKLKERLEELKSDEDSKSDISEQEIIEEIIYNSTPLIPEIKKAFDESRKLKTFNLKDIPLDVKLGYEVEKEEYISNLKLDI